MNSNPSRNPLRIYVPFLLSAGLGIQTASADEIYVDQNGLGDFDRIQNAIDAANDGDLILVRPGTFAENLVVGGKAIRIVAQVPGAVLVDGTLRIENIAKDQSASVIGIHVVSPLQNPLAPGLLIENTTGKVTIQDCQVTGYTELGGIALQTNSASRLVLSNSQFLGGEGTQCHGSGGIGNSGGIALRVQNSRIAAWDVLFEGGSGASCLLSEGGMGGPAIQSTNSRILVAGCQITGGNGGSNNDVVPIPGGNGGDGMQLDAGSELWNRASTTTPGTGGTSNLGPPGARGISVSGQGVLIPLTGPRRDLVTDTIVRAGNPHSAQVQGNPGERTRLLIYTDYPFFFDILQTAILSGSRRNFRGLPFPSAMPALGIVPASGFLTGSVSIPALAPTETSAGLTLVPWAQSGHFENLLAQPVEVVSIQCTTLLPDCDNNGRSDLCEIIEGTSMDLNVDGYSDNCQADCNSNGQVDAFDISSGASADINGDGIPDECQPTSASWFVKPAASPGGTGSAADPFRDIQAAVNVALPGDSILLLDGLYAGSNNRNIQLDGHELTIRSLFGPTACILDMQGQGRAFYLNGTIQQGVGVTFEGITFRNGNAPVPGPSGGAIRSFATSLTIRNCVFEDNQASQGGGAVHVFSAQESLIEGSSFTGNSSASPGQGQGGAVSGANLIRNCTFTGNHTASRGGAVHSANVISNCNFFDNSSGGGGGAVSGTASQIQQCLFAGNSSTRGGAINVQGSLNPNAITFLSNCTITGNDASIEGGGIAMDFSGKLQLRNTLLVNNTAPSGKEASVRRSGSDLSMEYSTIDGGNPSLSLQDGGTLSSVDVVYGLAPTFLDPDGPDNNVLTYADNDYRLAPGSVQIDGGSNALIPMDVADLDQDGNTIEPLPVDLLGNPRRVDDPSAPDSGQGTGPLVDQGAFER